MASPDTVRGTILLNGSYAPSLILFRGPLIAELTKAGYRVLAAAPAIDEKIANEIEALGGEPISTPLSRTGLNPIADFKYFLFLRRLIARENVSLTISYTIKPNIWGSLAAASHGVRSASMITGLGYAFADRKTPLQRFVGAVSRRLYRLALMRNDVVIFQNPDDQKYLIEEAIVSSAAKTRLVDGSGVDLKHFTPSPPPAEQSFLCIARLLGAKGVREYADASCQLIAEGSDWRFRLAGFIDEGPDAIAPEELATWTAKGLEYLGPLSDVRPAIADCSIYVLPSYREGTPRTVLEAMACRRPVIATDVPGCRETTVDGITGILVPVRDVPALVSAMRRLGQDPAMAGRMGEEGLVIARSRYDVHRVNAILIDHLGLRT